MFAIHCSDEKGTQSFSVHRFIDPDTAERRRARGRPGRGDLGRDRQPADARSLLPPLLGHQRAGRRRGGGRDLRSPRLRRLRRQPRARNRLRRCPDRGSCRSRPRSGTARERRAAAPRSTARARSSGGWRRFLDLLFLMAVTDFKKAFFGTVLGYVWSLLRPLLLFGVLLAVFTQILRVGSDQVENYPVFLLTQHRPVHVLPGGDDDGDHLGRRSRGHRPQDAVSPSRDPDVGGPDVDLQPRDEHDRGARLLPRLRRLSDLDLAADARDLRAADRADAAPSPPICRRSTSAGATSRSSGASLRRPSSTAAPCSSR